MLITRLILLIIQLAAAWYLAPIIKGFIPSFGRYDIFVWAVLFALLVTIVGWTGSLVLKEINSPTGATLATSLVLALVLAGLTLVPQVKQAIVGVAPGLRDIVWPLAGAVLGYFIKR
jgi:hypothetical protein